MFTRPLRLWSTAALAVSTAATMLLIGATVGVPAASAAQPTVGMGTAAPFAVLGGQTITNTGPSVISGELGLSPGNASSVTGFPPGLVSGAQHAADAVALQAQNDLTTAYNSAAGRIPATTVSADLGGQTLTPGVYKSTSSLGLTGTVRLDGQNNTNAVFIFQAGSTLTTASSSVVQLINGATWCNVYWQVGSSATLGTTTSFVGTIMALTSDTLNTGATVMGRVLARNGAVTLDTNTITQPACTTSTTTGTNAGGGSGSGGNAKGAKKTPTGNGLGGGGNAGGLGSGVVPTGFPATGLGGASRSDDPALVALGGLALIAGVLATGMAVRRRRTQVVGSHTSGPDAGGDA